MFRKHIFYPLREREPAEIALFISLETPTKGMIADAASAGFYTSAAAINTRARNGWRLKVCSPASSVPNNPATSRT